MGGRNNKKLTTEEFINKSINLYKTGTYNYDNVIYINNNTKVELYCANHNVRFWQPPKTHLRGQLGCKKCKQEKTIQTNLNKYATEYTFQSPIVKDKIKQTMMKRHGVENPMQLLEIRNKCKQTCIRHFGVDNPGKSIEIKEKMKRTNLKRYGIEYTMQYKKFMGKSRSTQERNNMWLPKHLISLKGLYLKEVMKHTRNQALSQLSNYNNRGKAGILDAYHLDHKVSIKYGFMNSIPPYIIGNICNLEMLPWKDNIIKGDSCSITLNTLILEIDNGKRT